MINFNKLITKHLEEERDKDEWGKEDTIKTYHPSYLGGCDRYLLTCKAGLRVINRTLLGIFHIGKTYHKLIQNLLPPHYSEVPIKYKIPETDLIINGHVDILHDDIVYDIKTVGSRWGLNIKQTKPSHKIQVHMYMYGVKAKQGSVIYIDKNTFKTKQFIFDYDKKIIKKTFNRIKTFHPIYMKWHKKGKIKDIPFDKCGCNYCKYEELIEESK